MPDAAIAIGKAHFTKASSPFMADISRSHKKRVRATVKQQQT